MLYLLLLFLVTLSDPNYAKPPYFDILYHLSYLRSEWRLRLQIWWVGGW